MIHLAFSTGVFSRLHDVSEDLQATYLSCHGSILLSRSSVQMCAMYNVPICIGDHGDCPEGCSTTPLLHREFS